MMEYKGYVGKVEFDPEANILHGEVVGIRDVVTFEGASVEEIQQAFHDSVDDYLDFCRQRGEEPDKPCSGRFVVRMDSDLHRRINVLAGASGRSLNAWVIECLSKEVQDAWPAPRPPKSGRRPAKSRPRRGSRKADRA